MIFAPVLFGTSSMSPQHLKEDRKNCRKIGPCGVGKDALYLNSFYIDRRYYVKYTDIRRVFKRVAMSKGGFSGKGIFGSMPYLVVQLRDGREKQCNFKYEEDVDRILSLIAARHPEIPTCSEEGEKRLAEARAKEEARYLKDLSAEAERTIALLENARDKVKAAGSPAEELGWAARQKRTVDRVHPGYRAAALAIFLLAAGACVFGIISVMQHKGYSVYFILFGMAFMLFAMSTRVMPTGRNNRKAAQKAWEQAVDNMKSYLKAYPDFPVPAQYAHPAVLDRMIRLVREGKAETVPEAYQALKEDLKAMNSSVQVSQTEYDEIVAAKPMFLVCDYQDQI